MTQILTTILFLIAYVQLGAVLCGASCNEMTNCSACKKNSDCEWCLIGAEQTVPGKTSTLTPLGSCQEKKTKCALQIGTLSPFLKRAMNIDLFSRMETEKDKVCFPLDIPQELFAPTCKACIDQKMGWCNADIKPDGNFGICLRDSLSFLCNSDFISKKSKIRMEMQYGKTMDACDGKFPPPPAPKSKCEDNFSCTTCTTEKSCTWCGPVVSIGTGEDKTKMNILGQCRSDGDCKKFKIGTFEGIFEKMGINIHQKIEPVSDYCTAIEWPHMVAEPNCKTCTEHKYGWCEAAYDKKKFAGMCMPQDFSLIACNNLVEVSNSLLLNLKTTFADNPKKCRSGGMHVTASKGVLIFSSIVAIFPIFMPFIW